MKLPLRLLATLCVLTLLSACGSNADDPDPIPLDPEEEEDEEQEVEVNGVPQFYLFDADGNPSENDPVITVIADSSDSISSPNDLEFHPFAERSDELWIINEGNLNTGGSTVTLFAAGTDDQDALWLRDGNAWHFLSLPTQMAFSDNGNWASGTGSQDNNQAGGSYAGPSLWSSDFDIYAAVGDPPTADVNGSHLDMLHGSPFSMGIAHEEEHAFWVFDGYHGYMVRYDFQEPHYPGGWDHSDGIIHRYVEIEVERHESLPSHLVLDKEANILYVSDTGNQRILAVDITAGEFARHTPANELLEEHGEMEGASFEVLVDESLVDPSGIALHDGILFVSEPIVGDVIAFDAETGDELDRIHVGGGIRGLTIGPDDRLWIADYDNSRILRIDPQ